MKTEAHKKKIAARKAERKKRKSHFRNMDVEKYSAYWRGVRAKNGIGPKPEKDTEANAQ
jgi:hypothetical protein